MAEEYVQDRELAGRLREIREQVRTRSEFLRSIRQKEDENLLYGDRDVRLFPQLRQHLEEVGRLWQVQEQPFRSRLPILGPLIAWFRERWNRISTKWYVLPILQQQVHFNAAVAQTLQDLYHFVQTSSYDLVRRMDGMFYPLDHEQAALHAALQDLRAVLQDQAGTLKHIQQVEEQLASQQASQQEQLTGLKEQQARMEARWEQRHQELAHRQELDRRGLAFLRMKLDRMLARPGPGEAAAAGEERETLYDHDYYRFEDFYRREEEVRGLQREYLPFFQGRKNVLDLGCGKGEFLELLREHGIEGYGVDLNEEMVCRCQEKGLRALHGDALQHLAGLPDDSLGGLFAAHLVEHLPPRVLRELIRTAWSKLQPGAYLILETPNPLCLWALVNYFYLDMSHVKPIHPQALTFLLEMHGFQEVEVRYLHPVPEGVRMVLLPEVPGSAWEEMAALLNTNFGRLNDLLYGYADYAVIARK